MRKNMSLNESQLEKLVSDLLSLEALMQDALDDESFQGWISETDKNALEKIKSINDTVRGFLDEKGADKFRELVRMNEEYTVEFRKNEWTKFFYERPRLAGYLNKKIDFLKTVNEAWCDYLDIMLPILQFCQTSQSISVVPESPLSLGCDAMNASDHDLGLFSFWNSHGYSRQRSEGFDETTSVDQTSQSISVVLKSPLSLECDAMNASAHDLGSFSFLNSHGYSRQRSEGFDETISVDVKATYIKNQDVLLSNQFSKK